MTLNMIFAQNVGIGTSNPTKGRLVVRGTVGAVSAMFGDDNWGVAIENSFPGIGLNTYYNSGTGRKTTFTGYGGYLGLNPSNGDFMLMSSSVSTNTDAFMTLNQRLLINKDGNIGVQGVTEPAMPLSFSNTLGNKISLWGQSANTHYGFGIQSSLLQMYTPTNLDDIAFGVGSSSSFTERVRIKGNGNVGIGEPSPAYKLDLKGRMRIQHNPGATAGIYFDGNTEPTRSFIGTFDDDYVGMFGSGGAGWGFVMNVENGNTGLGTTAPTARLDVNGNVRIRGSFPKKGSVLTSDNTNGNASWADPVAFKASGRNTDNLPDLPLNTWTKWYYENIVDYNVGLAYQPPSSQLSVVEDGIYHLNTQISMSGYGENVGVRLMLNRGGDISVLATQNKVNYSVENPPTLSDIIFIDAVAISTDVKLLAGDFVYVEFIFNTTYNNSPFPLSSSNDRVWFSGHLVARL